MHDAWDFWRDPSAALRPTGVSLRFRNDGLTDAHTVSLEIVRDWLKALSAQTGCTLCVSGDTAPSAVPVPTATEACPLPASVPWYTRVMIHRPALYEFWWLSVCSLAFSSSLTRSLTYTLTTHNASAGGRLFLRAAFPLILGTRSDLSAPVASCAASLPT